MLVDYVISGRRKVVQSDAVKHRARGGSESEAMFPGYKPTRYSSVELIF